MEMIGTFKSPGAGKKISIFIFVGLFIVLAPEVSAHDFWVDQKGKEFWLIYGHGDHREEVDPSKVKVVKAFSPSGGEIEVRRERKGKEVLLQPSEPPSWIFVEIDNGYWSKTIYGWKNLPKRKASRVVEANRSIYYSKALMAWSDLLLIPLGLAQLDICLRKNPYELKAGDSLPIQVINRGKPVAGAEVEGRDHEVVATTDKDGMARVRISGGRQLISVSRKEATKDDPDADYLSLTATLTFEVGK
jgi:nickel transport protein